MTRAAQAMQPVAEKGKARTAARALAKPPPMKFLIVGDNGGAYHWTIVAGSGETLVRSAAFASHEEASQAARVVHAGAASASLEHLGVDAAPVDLATRRQVRAARDALDTARWLDEGGSLSREAMMR